MTQATFGRTDLTVVPVSARSRFAEWFSDLVRAAGDPSLRSVAATVGRASSGPARAVTVQRLSDWKSGRAVPAQFESVRPVVTFLINRAKTRQTTQAHLLNLTAWKRLWAAANAERPVRACPPIAAVPAHVAPAAAIRLSGPTTTWSDAIAGYTDEPRSISITWIAA